MSKSFSLLVLPLLAVALVACATSIPVTVTKPAEVNMTGNRVIAVLDFRYPEKDKALTARDLFEWAVSRLIGVDLPRELSTEGRVADHTTALVITTLLNTGYFELVSPQEVARAMRGSLSVGTTAVDIGKAVGAQGIISGELYLLDSNDRHWVDTRKVKDPKTGVEVKQAVPMVTREAWVGMTYQVVNTATGAIVASRSFKGEDKADVEEARRHSLPSAEQMYKRMIDDFMPVMAKQLAPYRVRESRRLMRDKTRDPRVREADDLVKARLYDEALEILLQVWNRSGNTAAGFNAAIVYEITGDLERGIEQMREVARRTGERRAIREYNRLLVARREQERLRAQL